MIVSFFFFNFYFIFNYTQTCTIYALSLFQSGLQISSTKSPPSYVVLSYSLTFLCALILRHQNDSKFFFFRKFFTLFLTTHKHVQYMLSLSLSLSLSLFQSGLQISSTKSPPSYVVLSYSLTFLCALAPTFCFLILLSRSPIPFVL